MIVADLSPEQLRKALAHQGLRLRTGPFVTSIRASIDAVTAGIALHYRRHPVEPDDGFADFHVSVRRAAGLRRWVRPQVYFDYEGHATFKPLPFDQAFPIFEWGLNWCVSNLCHWYLVMHAAVIERSGLAVVLPAPPGSGKSTLCAGLVNRGWRLLSDELALLDPATGRLISLARPVSLKNESIRVMQAFAPGAGFSAVVRDTSKGDVAHMRPPDSSVARVGECARPAWVVLPRYQAGAAALLEPLPKARAFMHLLEQSFNYNVHARAGFDALGNLVDASDCYEFSYGNLDDAVAVFDRLALARGCAPA